MQTIDEILEVEQFHQVTTLFEPRQIGAEFKVYHLRRRSVDTFINSILWQPIYFCMWLSLTFYGGMSNEQMREVGFQEIFFHFSKFQA